MTTSFYNGITGLMSFQNAIDVWGNNIANINTTAYKENIPEFATLFANQINSNPVSSDIGMGSRLSSTAINLNQGSLINTDNPFDIALGGEGWLQVNYNGATYYTRDGSFKRDADGYLVNDSGAYLEVANANNLIQNSDGTYKINRDIKTDNLLPSTNLSPIKLPNNVILPAVATSEVKLETNLNNSDTIDKTSLATTNSDFSALYNKDSQDMKIRNGDSLVFGFGNPATYENNLITTNICLHDDEKDGKDVNIDFTINGKEIKLTLPDGSTKSDIQNAIHTELDKQGILNVISDNGIKISDPQKIIISSNDNIIPNVAVAKLTYEIDPQNEYQFSTINDLDTIIQKLANVVYPNDAKVEFNDGKIQIFNNSESKTLNSYILKTENSNDLFITNLGRVGNEIYPQTASSSYEFLTNNQSFGGDIIDNNGNKDTISFSFTKQKVLNNQILWNGEIKITDPSGNTISTQNNTFAFDTQGNLISPKTITISTPQNITINFNLTSYQKTNSATSYIYSQNGIEQGYLKNYEITEDGKINGIFSNNQIATLGQIPIVHFQNDQGLASIGGNLFKETDNSNKAFEYVDKQGNYISGAKVLSNKIEDSNVDMSQAMTELIITQKAFSAAAKTVTTSDQMIQRAIDMKRG